MLLVPVVAILILFTVLLGLLQVIHCTLQQDLHMLHKVTSTYMAASLHHHMQW